MEVVKRIIADVLYRHLGNYVDGLTKESIGNGIWEGNLELRALRLRAESLAVLFENFGLDLPVTVTAGYVGLLCVEVPWTNLQSMPVRIVLTDVAVVASPVSDGEQKDLSVREKRLKNARLATDESVRDVKFSLRNAPAEKAPSESAPTDGVEKTAEDVSASSGWTFGFGLNWWKRYVMRIVDNIQIQIENVIVQYEDSSSVRGHPYTCSLALDSLTASAADYSWSKAFNVELAPVVHKIAQLEGLVLNWAPGTDGNELKSWIDSSDDRHPGRWAGYVRSCNRHAIEPMNGELRVSMVRPSALAEALSSTDPSKTWLKNRPRVEMDLHIPDIAVCLDDFNYHTLLSTVMYLSDIDRRVRPTTAKGRWRWAVDRLLPRFMERRKATMVLHDPEKLRERRELREEYIMARNSVVMARRKGRRENQEHVAIVERIENQETYEDILLFRDMADRVLLKDHSSRSSSKGWSFWSSFKRIRGRPISKPTESNANEPGVLDGEQIETSAQIEDGNEKTPSQQENEEAGVLAQAQSINSDAHSAHHASSSDIDSIPRLRMAFLLERGAIKLSRGGFPEPPSPLVSLEFSELRLGITSASASNGFLVEAVLGAFEAYDLQKETKFWYARTPRLGDGAESGMLSQSSSHDEFQDARDSIFNGAAVSSEWNSISKTTDRSYPSEVASALRAIRSERGAIESSPSSLFRANEGGNSAGGIEAAFGDPSSCAAPLKYIAALRISEECSNPHDDSENDESERTRLAMDLSIGGMEVILDGPECAFISTVSFWSPREKLPSIMAFLSRSAAPRLAFLRMEVQKAILEHKEPMRMDLYVRAPRFIVAPVSDDAVSMVVDLGTFAMETSTRPSQLLRLQSSPSKGKTAPGSSTVVKKRSSVRHCEVQYTDYVMSFSDLGLFLVSGAKNQMAERLVKPFSLSLSLQILHNPSYVEALTSHLEQVDVSKVKLAMTLSSLSTSISHKAFRQVLGVVRGWSDAGVDVNMENPESNRRVSVSADEDSDIGLEKVMPLAEPEPVSALVSFEMHVELEKLKLELRDGNRHRIVTVSSTGTECGFKRRQGVVELRYQVHTFAVTDGSRGATAPYQCLAYAGSRSDIGVRLGNCDILGSSSDSTGNLMEESDEGKAFVSVSYIGDLRTHEQTISVEILSLHLVCVRETYLALADFFYLVENYKDSSSSLKESRRRRNVVAGNSPPEEAQGEYADPFNALGMTTVSVARKFREKANMGMEMSKQALANRGKLVVTAALDGVGVVLVSGEGAIATFEVGDCKSRLTQMPCGSVEASGQLGRLLVKDLTAAYEVYSNAVEYNRAAEPDRNVDGSNVDGWTLRIPNDGSGDPWLIARLRNLKVVYVQRFVVILRKYFGVLRDNLRPVLEIKGGIAEVFDDDIMENLSALAPRESRVRLNCITENINVIIPRHSQSPHEALRFIVGHSAVTNEDEPAPGYKLGIQICTGDVKGYVLYDDTGGYHGEEGSLDDIPLKPIEPFGPTADLVPFTENGFISAKLDLWRRRRVPKVVVNSEGVPVLKDGEEERMYDPSMWKPMLRVRVCAPKGLSADLCEAQYSILYFCFTENLIERPDIEFTDIVRGLKTPVLPPRKPIRPIMLSSHRMPPNYEVLFEVPFLASTIMHGSNPLDKSSRLIQTELRNITGSFEYGVDYRMTVEVCGSLHSLVDIRPHAVMPNATIISSAPKVEPTAEDQSSITLNWDRPHGYRANVMVVVSDIRVVVVPELFRDLGLLTTPGFPYLKSSAPAPFLRFNGRQLILTVSRPEVWLMAHQYPGDNRSLVLRGDLIAKVQWAAVTGRNTFELAAHGLSMNLSNRAPQFSAVFETAPSFDLGGSMKSRTDDEVPLLYPSDISLKHQGSGYDPPTTPGGEPIKTPGAELTVDAESLLLRVDVNDIPLILAIGSRLGRLRSSVLSVRPPLPGRFDEWLDKCEQGDAKLFAVVSVPHARLIFTDEVSGYYVPIMELRVGNAVVRSNVWVTNAKFEFSIDLFNDEKGWWEPGVEPFSFEVAVSRGKSGSEAVQLRAEQTINANITPTTVSGAFRVVDTLKRAIEDLILSLKSGVDDYQTPAHVSNIRQSIVDAQRPSVAAFCVRNETGRSVSLWLPYDSLRRSLKGNGGECEIETPTEDLLWSAVSMNKGSPERMDGNRDRRLSMQCMVAMNGYDPVSLSAAEVGSRIIYLFPEASRNAKQNDSSRESIQGCLTLVWAVSMRNGVPVGCLRSLFRIVNETRTVFGINLGQSIQKVKGLNETNDTENSRYSQDSALGADDLPIWIKAGESWSVPVHAVESSIRIRPIVFEAPDVDTEEPENDVTSSPANRSRVVYRYHWSDPLSKFSSLLDSGLKLEALRREEETAKSSKSPTHKSFSVPSLSCRSVHHGNPFTVLLIPRVGSSSHLDLLQSGGKAMHWVDIVVRAPFLVSNSLPRPVSFAIASTRQMELNEMSTFVVKEWIEPLRTVHVHTAGIDLSHLSAGIGYDNCPVTDLGSSNLNSLRKTRNVPGVHRNLGSIAGIPVGSHGDGNCKFLARLDRAPSDVSKKLTLFSEFWIRNRSSSDLMFKNSSSNTEVLSSDVQEIFLRSRPPGTLADKYIAFSGSWIAFRTVAEQSEWKPMSTDVLDMERPFVFVLGKVSLIAEVRPARGEFHRTLIVTIRNAMWIENRTDVTFLWCQPAALDSGGNALVAHVHVSEPGSCVPLNWDFEKENKDICLRRAESDGSSDWIWSRPIAVQGMEGDFAAKMYRPRRHEQYIARVAVTRLAGGVGAVVIHKEDRNTPPYRIVNLCKNRSVAFRQNGVQEKSPWLVRPGKSTRYSWDDPQSPLRRRCLVVEVIETVPSNSNRFGVARSMSTGHLEPMQAEDGPDGPQKYYEVQRSGGLKEIRHPNFNLNIDIIQEDVEFQHSKRFKPPLQISVHVDGPTKVVTFTDASSEVTGSVNSTVENEKSQQALTPGHSKPPKYGEVAGAPEPEPSETVTRRTLDVKLWVKALGLSFIDSTPTELAYLTVTGVHFRLDRFDGQQLIVCEVQDVQLDNQLPQAAWPVAIWSPAHDFGPGTPNPSARSSARKSNERKPFFELTIDGEYPHVKNGIGYFRGIYVALQQIQVNADEDFALRGWSWIRSLLAATGRSVDSMFENLTMKDGEEVEMSKLITESVEDEAQNDEASNTGFINRLYVTNLELCPVKVTVSFIPSRASSISTRSRSVVRTLVAVLGNVQNAEFRFNALELQHVFDSVAHFQSLIAEFYISQCASQKITLLTSNSIIGNPSALFDSIAIGAKDFFYEPAKAKGSADFIVSIGRGSSSLLTNTVGGLVGSIGEIPRAVAHGLETAVGDKDYLAERESIRGGRARSVTTPAQGLFNGALSFGHGIASGAAGLIRDPVQGAVEEGASGFMKGLRKGMIGGVLKPITGALDLIAEPAAGFRNFMVSDRNKFFSEPIRPARTFLGSHCDRLALYDFSLALGSIILQELNGSDSMSKNERLISWVDFTPRSRVLHNESAEGFLWALIRKSTRSPNSGRGQLSDVHGVVQRADKIRAGLITTRRVIVTSLNGHIVWEHPLVDVVSTQASVESRDFLSIGVRPVGSFNHAVPPTWEKIHCGTVLSRDAFNVALKKALADFGLTRARQRAAIYGMDGSSFLSAAGISTSSFEMVDLSSNDLSSSKSSDKAQNELEMKSLHTDASVDGRRGVFTEMNMPGRTTPGRSPSTSSLSTSCVDVLTHRVKSILRTPDTDLVKSGRSVRVVVVNRLSDELRLVRSTMESGVWAAPVPSSIAPNSVAVLKAAASENKVKDVTGSFVYQIFGDVQRGSDLIIALRFVNPMLAANAYAVDMPDGICVSRLGGEKGDHAQTILSISENNGNSIMPSPSKPTKLCKSPEKLLFGKGDTPPIVPNARPPHAPPVENGNPDDPELIAKLSSLGFSRSDAHRALKLENADVSKAYARLVRLTNKTT